MLVVVLLGAAAVAYMFGAGRARFAGRRFPIWASCCFLLGLGAVGASLCGPLDILADDSLTWHMVQHFGLVSIAAPLLVLGAPVRLALTALPRAPAQRLALALHSPVVRWVSHPAVAWLQFLAVLYGTHFSPLYELALERPAVHEFEHALYLGSALLFWTPLLAVAPAPHAPPHPVRILALFLALPMSAFLGFLFYVDGHVEYAHYARLPGALADQAFAGEVMWIAGGMPLFVAFLWCIADWAARERRLESSEPRTLIES